VKGHQQLGDDVRVLLSGLQHHYLMFTQPVIYDLSEFQLTV
jgi:hypothetical protein